jgi:hypothetical protein
MGNWQQSWAESAQEWLKHFILMEQKNVWTARPNALKEGRLCTKAKYV